MKAIPLTDILPSGSWKGKRCFLLGGGSSLLSFKYQLLENELTIGVNKTIMKFSPTLNYSMDRKFYDYVTGTQKHPMLGNLKQMWDEYSGVKVFLSTPGNLAVYRDVYTVKKSTSRDLCFNLDSGIYAGTNSGFGALMLAIALGANPIYLLGYDMTSVRGKTHWHEGYPNQQDIKIHTKKLKKYINNFTEYASLISEASILVVNLNPDSALGCFSKSTLDEVMKG